MFVLTSTFQLAPDLLIIKNSESSQAFNKSDEYVVKVPHNLTEEDTKQLMNYFDLIAFNKFMKYFGIAPPPLGKPMLEDF